jgi:hypothetical protein
LDGENSESAKALYASRAGYVGSLTRIRREIEAHKMSNGTLYDIEKKLESYDKGWREFVNTHEKYLDVIDSDNEKEAAYSLYEEQIKRRFEFGCMIKSWRGEVSQRENIDNVSCSKSSTRSRASSSSSRLSSLSERRERLALAQLKVDQIARKHELAKKMLDLQNESEMLEAQMQREEAMMSVSICEQVVQEEREQALGDIEEMNENNGQGRLDNAPTRSVQGEERVSLLKVDINDKHSLINQSELVERGAEFLSSDQPVGLANTPVPK